MADDRVVVMSSQGYKNLVNPVDGRGLHWVTDVNQEIPIKVRPNGPGSEKPTTIPNLFFNMVKSAGPRNAIFLERNNKQMVWNWNQYHENAMNFAKSLHHLQVKERSAVAIMGFNAPEWAFAFVGGVLNNCVGTGIYSTNGPEACNY